MWVYRVLLDIICLTVQVKNYLVFSEIDSISDKYISTAVCNGKKLSFRKKKCAHLLFTYQKDLYLSGKNNGLEMKKVCVTYTLGRNYCSSQ